MFITIWTEKLKRIMNMTKLTSFKLLQKSNKRKEGQSLFASCVTVA